MVRIIITLLKILAIFLLQYSLLSFFNWGQYLSLPLIFLVNLIIATSLKKFPWLEIILIGFLLGLISEVNYLVILALIFLTSFIIRVLAHKVLTNRSYIAYGLLTFFFFEIFFLSIWLTQKLAILVFGWNSLILLSARLFFVQILIMGIVNAVILIIWHLISNWWYKRYPLLQRMKNF